MYINDFENYLIGRGAPIFKLSSESVIALLFADDIALVAESKEHLQQLLDLASSYFRNKKTGFKRKEVGGNGF